MSYGYSYTFPALRGVQAGHQYFVAMCPMKLLPRIFLFDEAVLPPELRAQRILNTRRIPEIVNYIVENEYDYAFSAITASIDGEVHFEAAEMGDGSSDVGRIIVPMSARFVINDGQHRRAAIEVALEERPELGDETIAVVFFLDEGLVRSQQLFADLNKHAIKPTKSLGILFDYRDPLAVLSRILIEEVSIFRDLTEKEKTTISNRSIKLFTLSAIYQATGALIGKNKNQAISDDETQLAIEYWSEMPKVIVDWQLVADRKVASAEMRRDYVHAHNVLLHALGFLGHDLIRQHPNTWKLHLEELTRIDWSRTNTDVWEGRAMIGGQMSKARQNLLLTTIYLKSMLGLELTEKERENEQELHS
jgi:DNA sulfur modification protein DndB